MTLTNAENPKKVKAMKLLYLFVFAVCIAIVSALLSFTFNLSEYAYGHDIRYHYEVIRALDMAWNSEEGISRIIGLVGQDYGYGTGLFYSLIPAGIAVFLMNAFSLSISQAISFEIFILLSASGIVMFAFMKSVTKHNIISFITSIIYISSPYVLTDIYVRFAFSEMFLILAIPLIMWGTYELVIKKNIRKFFIPFVLGYSIAIMTHLTMTVFLTIIVLIFLLIYIKDIFRYKLYIPFIIATICVMLISAMFYVPMFINNANVGLDNMSYTSSFVSFNGLWSFILIWLIFSSILNIFTIWVFIKNLSDNRGNNSKNKKVLFSLLVLTFVMSTCLFPWFVFPNFVGIIQYSWRMFVVNMPILAISIGYLIKNDAFKSHKFALILGTVICLIGSLSVSLNYNFYLKGKEANTINKYSSSQIINGKSVNWGLGANKKGDYLPNGCTTKYLFNRAQNMILETDVEITEFANYQSINQLSFMISRNHNGYAVIDLPYKLFNDVEIYQISDDYHSVSLNVTKANNNSNLQLNFEEYDGECKITISYKENSALDNYLKQNPFEFIVESGDAIFSNFVKYSASNYQVDVSLTSTSTIELPTLYYEGYKITLTSNGVEQVVEPIFNENGFISITINESGTLNVKFEGKYVEISNNLAIVGGVVSLVLAIISFAIPKRYTILKQVDVKPNNKGLNTDINLE